MLHFPQGHALTFQQSSRQAQPITVVPVAVSVASVAIPHAVVHPDLPVAVPPYQPDDLAPTAPRFLPQDRSFQRSFRRLLSACCCSSQALGNEQVEVRQLRVYPNIPIAVPILESSERGFDNLDIPPVPEALHVLQMVRA